MLQCELQPLRGAGSALFSASLRFAEHGAERALRHEHLQRRPSLLQLELRHLQAARRALLTGRVRVVVRLGATDGRARYLPCT